MCLRLINNLSETHNTIWTVLLQFKELWITDFNHDQTLNCIPAVQHIRSQLITVVTEHKHWFRLKADSRDTGSCDWWSKVEKKLIIHLTAYSWSQTTQKHPDSLSAIDPRALLFKSVQNFLKVHLKKKNLFSVLAFLCISLPDKLWEFEFDYCSVIKQGAASAPEPKLIFF